MSKSKTNIDLIDQHIFYVVFFLWFSLDYLYSLDISNYSWGTYSFYLRLLSPLKYFLVIYIFIFRKYTLKGWLLISCISVILFLSARRSSLYDVFYAFLFIVSSKKEYIKKAIKMAAVLLIAYIIITLLCAFSGIINNSLYYRGNGMVRYSLGFPHPNQVGFRIFIVVSSIIWLREGRLRIYDYAFILITILLTWYVINSRTSCFCIILITFVSLFSQKYRDSKYASKKNLLFILIAGGLLINLLLLFGTIFYNGEGLLSIANKLLSQRLLYGHQAFEEFGTSLLGQQIYVTASERMIAGLGEEIIIDSAYINILMRSGIIVLILFLFGYETCLFRLVKENDYLTFMIMFILSVYGSIELMIYLPMWNIFLIFLTNTSDSNTGKKTILGHCKSILQTRG